MLDHVARLDSYEFTKWIFNYFVLHITRLFLSFLCMGSVKEESKC